MIKKIIEYLKKEQKNNKNEYDRLLLAEEAYNSESMEYVVDFFVEKFGQNIKAILDFCMQRGIVPDCSSEKEEKFIDSFSKLILKNKTKEKIITFGDSPIKGIPKISSLDDIVLVRRCNFLPKNDVVTPSINSLKQEITDNVLIDGKEQECKYYISNGFNTVHFCLNREVLPHVDAPKGWVDCKFTILQPMTEELYKSAVSFEPMDTFFCGTTKLDNYIVICDSLEATKELLTNNKSAIPIIVGKEKVPGFGNKIINCMGITCPYIDYYGRWHDYNIPMKEYYTKEFINNYPRFISDTRNATNHPLHEFYYDIKVLSMIIEKSKAILQLLGTDRSLEEILKIVVNNLENYHIFFPEVESRLKEYNITVSQLLPSCYHDLGIVLDYLYCNENFKNEEIDIQAVFEKMCEGLVIDETNINQLKKIKENVINMINSYINSYNYYEEKKVKSLKIKLLSLSVIMRTDAMKIPVEEQEIYNVPIEWYDMSNVEEQKQNQFNQSLQNGKLFEDAVEDLFQNSQIVVPDFPLQRPQSTTFARIKKLSQSDEGYLFADGSFPIINGRSISKDDIEVINQMVSCVTMLENDRINEFYESSSKYR